MVLCERIELPEDIQASAFRVILGAAEGEVVANVDVQKSALAVLVNCVCAPIHRPSGLLGRFGSTKKKTTNKCSEELIQKVWECVRANSGIIVLLQLMQIKGPIMDADCIRGMACRALAGLARSETVKQIISKLPLFTNGQLQVLMRDPILQEKRTDHVMFQKYALELMERVSGKSKSQQNNEFDTSMANIHKANVVAQTKIQFNEQQLNQLIHQHLLSRGLIDSAATFRTETGLNTLVPSSSRRNPLHSPFSYKTPQSRRFRMKGTDLSASLGLTQTPAMITQTGQTSSTQNVDQVDEANLSIATPIKIIKKNLSIAVASSASQTSIANTTLTNTTPQRSLQKQISKLDDLITTTPSTVLDITNKTITLDTIITEYLTNQHALCKNPMSTCPQFDLFIPHKCPDPKINKMNDGMASSNNFVGRFYRHQMGHNTKRYDRHLVHSQFSVMQTIKPNRSDHRSSRETFTCSAYSPVSPHIMAGSYNGNVSIFNINNSEKFTQNCNVSYINSIKCCNNGKMVLLSCQESSQECSLWYLDYANKQLVKKLEWKEEEYCEFNNYIVQDKILCTKAEVASIYDILTGRKISTFTPTQFNQYTKNRATFYPTDELILSDGVLWDVKSGKDIHKFDKLNQAISGVFHPNGLEVSIYFVGDLQRSNE